jgi:hypothetical protein
MHSILTFVNRFFEALQCVLVAILSKVPTISFTAQRSIESEVNSTVLIINEFFFAH